MDISAMKARKKELKMTLDEISAKSGIPKRTVEDIFREATKNPRIDTIQAIERALDLNQPAGVQTVPPLNNNGDNQTLKNYSATISTTDQKRLNTLLRAEHIFGIKYVDKLIELLDLQCKEAENKNR